MTLPELMQMVSGPPVDWAGQSGYLIAHFEPEVLVGTWAGDAVTLAREPDWDTLAALYVFNDQMEVRAVQTTGADGSTGFACRLRTDGPDEPDGATYDEPMYILGSDQADPGDDAPFFTVQEAGMCLTLPRAMAGMSLVVRNYIGYAQYPGEALPIETIRLEDWRFAGLQKRREGYAL